ncbi:MAG: Holliday junction branch migration protein RuvA [Treponema sp.]|nr:Holliday junction branch migration protein RuvA [Treponema sp.]
MVNSIEGTITYKGMGRLGILTGGLEWDIAVPAIDLDLLPPGGEAGRVYTWLYHRETEMSLYGFADSRRRDTFLELLKVEGIGPKGALRIMGGIGQGELEEALEREDLARLQAIPGLGKKTAQKMILALKGSLVSSPAQGESPYGELLGALMEMGYERKAAAQALAQAEKELGEHNEGDRESLLFKQAILNLSASL